MPGPNHLNGNIAVEYPLHGLGENANAGSRCLLYEQIALARILGRTGTMVVTRLLGMLLAALSVQFIIDGLRGTGLYS